ncbi:hypothetical protein AB0L88_31955 [Saccharopolyspora shandongensis]|uniref:Uncharacterized protein n=1 Tax=Saccharopolyspora shandongensis TaxID=418495 RepID=A0A1H3EQS1_9PSEU|nr:hypothetical protein [Saccharopolyspora shandongensis]SDX80299.1 hypothetical protein SAMN05216215_101597 [Saccharopolyspora shandongensis]
MTGGPALLLRPDDRDAERRGDIGGETPRVVRGSTVDLSGRGPGELKAEGGELPELGRWR